MANVLYKEITSQMAIKLDYFHYVYGNIKPDVNPGVIDWPHFSHQSLEDLVKYCEHIMITPMSVKSLSVALGVISHFICDYHCLYHTEPYRKQKNIVSIAKHTAYEHFLELSFIKKCIMGDIKVIDQVCGETIEDTINGRLALYNDGAHSIDKDIHYAVNTAICIVKQLAAFIQVPKIEVPTIGVAYDFLQTEII
ncbi:zinc dependent phospholipase C family protein [Cellulosilyticum sp. I15G10I2]|uniref:zinc dependent phospholipase C family protein n=1 Tax=Cellulosilyticum sp. I15G10I2 TaxID=1892843 RepID=UPI001A9A5BD7|nr:zinc dependent phospholipase C family protein [Cellulosilyticum sp. I15G10I2]